LSHVYYLVEKPPTTKIATKRDGEWVESEYEDDNSCSLSSTANKSKCQIERVHELDELTSHAGPGCTLATVTEPISFGVLTVFVFPPTRSSGGASGKLHMPA